MPGKRENRYMMFLAMAIGAFITSTIAGLINLPVRWLIPCVTVAPIVSYLLVGFGMDLWDWRRNQVHPKSSELDGLEGFIAAVRSISYPWYDLLELFNTYHNKAVTIFNIINDEMWEQYDVDDSPRKLRYNRTSEITAECLRIFDSIVSQLRAGHPDTAMGTVRSLFELSLAIEVISHDKSGESAEKYRDYDEADYLAKRLRTRDVSTDLIQSELDILIERYGLKNSPRPFAWIATQDGKSIKRTEDVIRYAVNYYGEDQNDSKFREYLHMWNVLKQMGACVPVCIQTQTRHTDQWRIQTRAPY